MLTNEHLRPIKWLRMFMGDLQLHMQDLKALDWSDIGQPFSKRQLIEQCWARFYKDFYLN